MFKNRKINVANVIFLALFLFFNPILVFAQTGNVSLSLRDATLKQFFSAVERQTDYTFSYRDMILAGKKSVTINVTDQPLKQVLNEVLLSRGLRYTVSGRSIAVTVGGTNDARKRISGTVLDDNGEPIIGANVVEKGTTNGTITDLDGKFSLEVSNDAILQVSYIGYTDLNLPVGESSTLNISMREDTQALDEVVVVGYGVQKKMNLTGAISSIKSNEITKTTHASLAQSLQGKVAGF